MVNKDKLKLSVSREIAKVIVERITLQEQLISYMVNNPINVFLSANDKENHAIGFYNEFGDREIRLFELEGKAIELRDKYAEEGIISHYVQRKKE